MAMKFAAVFVFLAWAFLPAQAAQAEGDRTITQVVKLLQTILDQSKKEGDEEQYLYGKYKCYCDTNEAQKRAEIQKLSEEIALLESDIDELQGANAKLSLEVGQLKKDMDQNIADRAEAKSIRDQEEKEYFALKADLEQAIKQMVEALKILSEIGADQTLQAAADHQLYMAGHSGASLANLKTTVRAALVAAGAFVNKKQATDVVAFLQAPFTGTYTTQSGEVFGILKDMNNTFTANLNAANEKEARQVAAYLKYKAEMEDAYATMSTSYTKKQGELSSNDGSLSTKRAQLGTAQKAKAEAEDFLQKLLNMCAAKKSQYNERVALRTNEDAAIAEAIAILNSDAAFATFGTVTATKTGATSFTQVRKSTVRRHRFAAATAQVEEPRREAAKAFLQKAAAARGSSALGRLASMLQAYNPFEVVLAEIQKMIDLLAQEGQQDADHHKWCDDEVKRTEADIATKTGQIHDLTLEIQGLNQTIDHPETGLIKQIADSEALLEENLRGQKTETDERKEEEVAYQQDIAKLVEAEKLLERAIIVLRRYYSKISAEIKAEMSLVQSRRRGGKRDDPAPPATWDDKYTGQTAKGGSSAIDMLTFIHSETKKEEATAHDDELKSQHSYEDSMASLKHEEATLENQLALLRQQLADAMILRQEKMAELAKTEEEKKTLEAYRLEIKPGCDFIVANLEIRNNNRANEETALVAAKGLIEGSPAFAKYKAEYTNETWGECKEICFADEHNVACKACLAHVTIPGYCAGHPSTEGCSP